MPGTRSLGTSGCRGSPAVSCPGCRVAFSPYACFLIRVLPGRIGLDKVLGINAFDPVKGAEMVASQSQTPHLDGSVTTVTFNAPGSVGREAVETWLQDLLWERQLEGKELVGAAEAGAGGGGGA